MMNEDSKKGWKDNLFIDKNLIKDLNLPTPSKDSKTPTVPKTTGDGTVEDPYVDSGCPR